MKALFVGTIQAVAQRFLDGAHIIDVEACDMGGTEVRLSLHPPPNFPVPTYGVTLRIERNATGTLRYIWNNVEYHGVKEEALMIEARDPGYQTFGGQALGFGANVNHSWECPETLKEEAYRRAAEAGMTVTFDVNRLTVVTARGTLHVEVKPPETMAGFTADMCMLTWQVELRELGLAA